MEAAVAAKDDSGMELKGYVNVSPGNIISISLGEDPAHSRQVAFSKAERLLAADPRGFNPEKNMQLVVPQPPFKPGSTERWPDKGLHVTVVNQGRSPWVAEGGLPDQVTEEMKTFHGREMQLSIDPANWQFLEGSPDNDDGVKLVFYLSASLDEPSRAAVAGLRSEMGYGPVKELRLHASLAGVAPTDGDYPAFRRRFCRPRPMEGLPLPYHQLIDRQAEPAPDSSVETAQAGPTQAEPAQAEPA